MQRDDRPCRNVPGVKEKKKKGMLTQPSSKSDKIYFCKGHHIPRDLFKKPACWLVLF